MRLVLRRVCAFLHAMRLRLRTAFSSVLRPLAHYLREMRFAGVSCLA